MQRRSSMFLDEDDDRLLEALGEALGDPAREPSEGEVEKFRGMLAQAFGETGRRAAGRSRRLIALAAALLVLLIGIGAAATMAIDSARNAAEPGMPEASSQQPPVGKEQLEKTRIVMATLADALAVSDTARVGSLRGELQQNLGSLEHSDRQQIEQEARDLLKRADDYLRHEEEAKTEKEEAGEGRGRTQQRAEPGETGDRRDEGTDAEEDGGEEEKEKDEARHTSAYPAPKEHRDSEREEHEEED